jgi:hypothetical protein
MSSIQGFVYILLVSFLVRPSNALAEFQCALVFNYKFFAPAEALIVDPRPEYIVLEKKQKQPLLKIGEGNSATIHLYRDVDGSFKVIKIYREERKESLERDHLGLLEVKEFFELDKSHSPNLKVVSSEIRYFFLPEKTKVLVTPFVPGINLHKLLMSTSSKDPLRQNAIRLYNQMIKELQDTAHRLGIQDEVRTETQQYFQDRQVDGLLMLRIYGRPPLLIKTDNLIFNPEDSSLTLIDPY